MQPITQEVRDKVLSLIPHENHRKLATMLMDGKTDDEIKVHGFDNIQIKDYSGLIASVISGETPVNTEAPAEEPATEVTTPEDTPTAPSEVTPEVTSQNGENGQGGQDGVDPYADTPAQPQADQPTTTEDTTLANEETPADNTPSDPVVGEIPA